MENTDTINKAVEYLHNQNFFELILQNGDFNKAVEYLRNQTFTIEHPKKPVLPAKPKPEDYIEHGKALQEYEPKLEVYNQKLTEYKKFIGVLEGKLIDWICQDAGLNNIPEKYRSKVFSYAWERNHSYGYHDVRSALCELVDIFE